MDEQRLASIRERERQATPGPWDYIGEEIVGVVASCNCPAQPTSLPADFVIEPTTPHESHDIVPPRFGVGEYNSDHPTAEVPDFDQWKADCQFIANARQDILLLLGAIDEAHGIIHDMMLDAAPAVEAERAAILRYIDALEPPRWKSVVQLVEWLQSRGRAERDPLPPQQARDEIDRLRAALRRIADTPMHDVVGAARNTLEVRQIACEALGENP